MYTVEIRTEPARRLAGIAHLGSYQAINQAFDRLFATLGARGLVLRTGHLVGLYHDDPATTAPDALRSHAAVEIGPDVPCDPPLQELSLPGGRHAVLTVTGPYSGLAVVYDHLFGTWLPASGEKAAGPGAFEIYLNTPMDTSPERLVTEICLPLQA